MECPFCTHENIEGVDQCARCDADLTDVDGAESHDIEQVLMRVSLAEVVCDDFLTAGPDETVRDVVAKMADDGSHCALVMDGGKLAGIFTERDVLNKIALEFAPSAGEPVSKFMTANPETLNTEDPIAFALNRMVVGGYRHLPILQNDQLAGIVSVKHIFGYLSTQFSDVVTQG